MDARSGVGASGLMQIMPATARWTAKIGLTSRPARSPTATPTSAIGTSYLKLVLDDFGGSRRDGRRRLQRRAEPAAPLARRAAALEPAAWAENIPFNETRDYVKKVLHNATVYAAVTGAARPR